MKKRSTLNVVLAIAGAALTWFPLLAPVVITIVFFIQERQLRFDALIPAELFPFVLGGGALLLWAALRERAQRRLIGWGMLTAVLSLVISQAAAVFTGMATGDAEPAGIWFVVVFGLIALYTLAVIAVAVGGALLLRRLLSRQA